MKANTMLETIRSLLGMPACAIPLSVCKPARSYLLTKADIPVTGTAILFTIPYVMTADTQDPQRNLSLYAIPRDYHGYITELSETLIPRLTEAFPAHRFALFSDHSPIDEVDAAARAGLGVLGVNGLLITPEYGSFVFIGEVVTDANYTTVTSADVPSFADTVPLCEECGACVAACPIGKAAKDRTMCLSALTQKKGALSEEEACLIHDGGLVWGCDACQLACPHNHQVIRAGKDTPIPYFREERLKQLDASIIDNMSDHMLATRAYAWRGRAVIRRNIELFEIDTERRNS